MPYLNNAGGGWQPKATMYGGIISGLYYDDHGDSQLAEASKNCMFNMEKFTSSAMTLWHEFYKGISRANFVLENVPKMTSVLDKATIENYVAQGKFFRAYAYFYLVKEFGDVPYVTKPYTSTEGMFVERTPAAEVYKNIIDELTPLAEGTALPQKSFYDNGCRVTRAMAQTLLAEVYLQRAGFPCNGGDADYKQAAKYAEMVINGGTAELEQKNGSSRDLNSAYNVIKNSKTSKEIIYAKEYDYSNQKIGNGYVNHCMGTDATTWKDADGKSLFKMNVMHKTYQPSDIILNSYADNDVRGMEKQFFFKNWTDATGVTHTLDYPGIWAWFEETAITEGTSGDNNIPTMRYAEVLLNYAECCLRTGDNATAKTLVNQIQQRAGSKTISDNVDLITLKKEKGFELWFENCRYQDVMRWSKLDNDAYDQECIARLKQAGSAVPHLFDKVFRKPQAGDENIVWEHGTEANSRFYIVHTHEAKDQGNEVGWQEKHRLFPYPQTIMDQNPNLVQNPGW